MAPQKMSRRWQQGHAGHDIVGVVIVDHPADKQVARPKIVVVGESGWTLDQAKQCERYHHGSGNLKARKYLFFRVVHRRSPCATVRVATMRHHYDAAMLQSCERPLCCLWSSSSQTHHSIA